MNKLYYYSKNGHYYHLIDEVRCKDKTSGKWYDAVLYADFDGLYVREKNDFYNKFEKKK